MSQKIIGKAWANGYGLCVVESNEPSRTTVILRPLNDPSTTLIRNRATVQWRRNAARSNAA